MIYPIESAEKVSATTTAKTVETGFRAFLIKNASTGATVYFRDCYADGAAVTDANGYALSPGESVPVPLRAGRLSVKATDAADVHLLYLGEGF